MKFLTFTLFMLLAACVTTHPDPRLHLLSPSEYQQQIERNTQNTKVYDGFMNTMDISATVMNNDVLNAQADHNARIYQWTPEQYAAEKTKSQSTLERQTQFFLSFFVPERKHDDLHKNNSKWKVFLDVNGKRYESKPTERVKGLLVELQSLYPQHTRWHTGYRLNFPVATSEVQNSGAKLTFTGPVGSTFLDFPPLK